MCGHLRSVELMICTYNVHTYPARMRRGKVIVSVCLSIDLWSVYLSVVTTKIARSRHLGTERLESTTNLSKLAKNWLQDA